MLLGYCFDSVHFRWFTHEMNGHDGPSSLSDHVLNLLWVDIEGIEVDIYEHRLESNMEDSVTCGYKRQRRNDYFITSGGAKIM